MDFEIVSASSSQSAGVKRELPPPGGPGASASEVVAALYAEAYPMVSRILGRAGIRRREERAELAHDVFIIALEVYAKRDPAVPILAWLAALTWNVIRNHRALERVKREAPVDPPEPASGAASPEETAGHRRYLLDLLDGLDDERRAVFDMHEIEGFELPEIARARGVSVGTATTRLRLAHKHVKAVAARLEATAARIERRPVVLPALVPFGVGAWRGLGQPFDDVAPGTERHVWRAICRSLAAGLGRGAGAAVAGKVVAALLGAGAVAGGGAVFLALSLARPLSPAPPPAASISRGVDAVTLAPVGASTSEAPPARAVSPGVSASSSASAVARPGATATAAIKAIDPEEERLIQQAQAAFAHKNYDAARDALREHAARFPHGQLVVDRKGLLSQMALDAGLASPNSAGVASPLDGGRAPHRQFGTAD